jgi:hypothetical protein
VASTFTHRHYRPETTKDNAFECDFRLEVVGAKGLGKFCPAVNTRGAAYRIKLRFQAMNLRHAAVAVSLVLSILPSALPQKPVAASEADTTALRSFASALEKCPDAFAMERHWGKGRLEIERVYLGHPKSVVWRSVQEQSRWAGYIEFSSSVYVRVPAEAVKKYTRQRVVEPADLPTTSEGVPFLPTEDGFPIADTRYRYEFALRPEGITLTKVFRWSPDGTWQAVEAGYPCAVKSK